MAHDYDLRNTSILSQSYMKGVERLTGNGNTYEEEFKLTEEIFESRKKTWSWLFDKFSEISDNVELNLKTLKPDDESSSSHSSEVRIPIRKSTAQLQYWIDTGNPPCKVIDVVVSDSEETLSISESEPTNFDEDQSSPCTSMIVNKKLTNSEGNIINAGSSASSVDTIAYILENTNSGVKNDRNYRGFNIMENLDNNIVRRSIRTAKPKDLLNRSLDIQGNVENKVRRSARTATLDTSVNKSMNVEGNEENKFRRSIRIATPKALLSRSIDIQLNEDKFSRSIKTATSKSSLNRSLDIRENVESKIVDRSIEPKVLLSRCTVSLKNAEAFDKSCGMLPESMSANVDGETNSQSRNADTVDIDLDNNISCKIDNDLKKGTRIEKIKDSEATFESKESGLGSSAIESTGKGDTNESRKSSNASEKNSTVKNQSFLNKRRKLYTKSDTFFDLVSPIVNTVQRIKAARKSFHPALDSPSVSNRKKTTSGPRLLTMQGRKSVNCSIRKRNKNKSINSKSKSRLSSRNSRTDKPRTSDSVKTSISLVAEVPHDPLTVGVNDAEKNGEIASLVEETLPKAAATMSKSMSSSSLSSDDVSQIINAEMNKILETPVIDRHKKNELDHSPIASPLRSEKRHRENDQGSIFQPSTGSSSESKESRLRSMILVKKNLCKTDLRSSMDTDSPSISDSCNNMMKDSEDTMSNSSTILLPQSKRKTRSFKLLKNDFIENLKSSSEFDPKVILHDFLKLRNCCEESEKVNKNWLSKRNEREDLKTDEMGVEIKNDENYLPKRNESENLETDEMGVEMKNDENFLPKRNESENLKTDEIGIEKENDKNCLPKRNESENLQSDDNRVKKKNIKNSLRKRNERDNLKTDKIVVEKKVNSDEKKIKNIKTKKKMDEKVPHRKKLRLETETATSKICPKILFTSNTAFDIIDSDSEEKTTYLGIKKANDDCNDVTTTGSSYSREIKPKATLLSKENPRITFTNTNHNRWESLFILTSSDEEDLIAKLNNTSKSRSFRNKSNQNNAAIEPSTNVVLGTTSIDDSVASKFTKTIQDSYKIVCSSSEEEKKITVKSRPSRIVTKKYSKRNKRENLSDLTIRSREDECGYRSESSQIENEKLEKQSPGVNIRRSERKKGKQSSETRRKDHTVSQSRKMNRETRSEQKLREEKVFTSSDNSDTVISSKKQKNVDRISEPNRILDNRTMPVDRHQEKREATQRRLKNEIFHKIACAADFTDSEEEPKVNRLLKRGDRSKSSSNTEEKDNTMMRDAIEPRIAPSNVLIFASSDESLDNDDVMSLFSSNYPGDNIRNKNKNKDNESWVVGSIKDPAQPNKRETKVKKDVSSSSRKKTSKNRRCTNSTIIFRTKEYWELDSDKS